MHHMYGVLNRTLAITMAAALIFSSAPVMGSEAPVSSAKVKIKLSKTSLTLKEGKTKTLRSLFQADPERSLNG